MDKETIKELKEIWKLWESVEFNMAIIKNRMISLYGNKVLEDE